MEHMGRVVREQHGCDACGEPTAAAVYEGFCVESRPASAALCPLCAPIADQLPWGGGLEHILYMGNVLLEENPTLDAARVVAVAGLLDRLFTPSRPPMPWHRH